MQYMMRVIGFAVVATIGVAAGVRSAGAATVRASYCENDKCMLGGWCQDGGLGTKCNMGTLGGCINEDCKQT